MKIKRKSGFSSSNKPSSIISCTFYVGHLRLSVTTEEVSYIAYVGEHIKVRRKLSHTWTRLFEQKLELVITTIVWELCVLIKSCVKLFYFFFEKVKNFWKVQVFWSLRKLTFVFWSLRKLTFVPHPKRSFSQSSFESKMFLSSGLGMYKWLFSHSFAFKWGLDIIVSSFFLQNTLLMYSQPNFCFSRIIQTNFQICCKMDFRALSIAPLLGQKGHESLAVQSLLFSIATFFPGNK